MKSAAGMAFAAILTATGAAAQDVASLSAPPASVLQNMEPGVTMDLEDGVFIRTSLRRACNPNAGLEFVAPYEFTIEVRPDMSQQRRMEIMRELELGMDASISHMMQSRPLLVMAMMGRGALYLRENAKANARMASTYFGVPISIAVTGPAIPVPECDSVQTMGQFIAARARFERVMDKENAGPRANI